MYFLTSVASVGFNSKFNGGIHMFLGNNEIRIGIVCLSEVAHRLYLKGQNTYNIVSWDL